LYQNCLGRYKDRELGLGVGLTRRSVAVGTDAADETADVETGPVVDCQRGGALTGMPAADEAVSLTATNEFNPLYFSSFDRGIASKTRTIHSGNALATLNTGSASGLKRQFGRRPITSGLPLGTDAKKGRPHVSNDQKRTRPDASGSFG
jgi:hypothetical protein